VKTIRDSDFHRSSENWFFVHCFGIPHNEFRGFCLPVIDKTHQVTVIFTSGVFSLVEENFSCGVSWPEVYFINELFFLEIKFARRLEIDGKLTVFIFR
jgi:hypothetical protein